MIEKYNKGASHISFIISFILFISFIIFFISLLNPFEEAETGKSFLLKHLESGIIKEVSEEVLVVSALEDQSGDCLEINSLGIKNYIIKQEGNLLKIYSSDEFLPNTFLCTAPPGYEIGLVRAQKYILESKFLDLNDSYENNYDTLKENFGIPEINDFEFSFLKIDEIPIIETKSKETPPTEVLAELIPINYLDENDVEIKNGYIKVILW